MRISSFLFSSLLFMPVFHAESAQDLTSALSELDDAASDWQYLLQKARSKLFTKEASGGEYECTFDDLPKIAAPDWICLGLVEGFDIAAVGMGYDAVPADQVEKVSEERGDYINKVDAPIKAYIEALVSAQAMIKVAVDKQVREHNNADDVKIKEDEVLKQITSLTSLSGKVHLKHMLKTFVEYDKNGKKITSVNTSLSKLVYKSEHCKALIKTFVQTTSDDTVDIAESKVSRGQCGFHQIVEDMSASGWKLLDMIKSPGDVYYALVGYSEPVDDQVETAIKTSLENDQKLWEQFKAQQEKLEQN